MLDKLAFDVTDFAKKHPGGALAFKDKIGRDIAPFLNDQKGYRSGDNIMSH